MKKLAIQRFQQIDSMGCVIACLASVLTYYKIPNSSYEDIEKDFYIDRQKGVSGADIILYLNKFGFKCTVIGLPFSAFTYEEALNFSEVDIKKRLSEFVEDKNVSEFALNAAKNYLKCIEDGNEYKLQIPNSEILKSEINKGRPVILGVQPRVYGKEPLGKKDYLPSHAVIAHGYDENGFFITDPAKGKGHEDLQYLKNEIVDLALKVNMNVSLGDECILIIQKK